MKKIIIAEKPSVARNIADALDIKNRKNGYLEGDEYIITWVFGHLLSLCDVVDYDEKRASWRLENFPFIPDEFRYKVKPSNDNRKVVDDGAKKQLELISSLIQREDVHGVISATDWDREGQIIADEILLHLGIDKKQYRLLINEWTKDEVLKGLQSLIGNEEMSNLSNAGFARQIADWLIGINLTTVATTKHNNTGRRHLLNIGRVLMPTLKIVYDREKEIEAFEKSSTFKLAAIINKDELDIDSVYTESIDDSNTDRFEEKEFLEKFLPTLENKRLKVIDKAVDRKTEKAPYLFNLTNLQGYITGKYKGFTADKVLKVAQSLYEKKIITYPRTASVVLDESLIEKTRRVFEVHKNGSPFENQMIFHTKKRLFDSSKVESHSAIIPTYIKAKNISKDEQIVYDAVLNRFYAQFLPDAISEETKIILKVIDENNSFILDGDFRVKGKVQVQEGYRLAENIKTQDTLLPNIDIDEILDIKDIRIDEIKKKPPSYHTEKTLLKVMETCGKSFKDDEEESDEMMSAILSGFSIGTPATRGETIKKLKDVGYIEVKGKKLLTTDLGKMMVETFPVDELFDLEYTGRLEKTLFDIEKGIVNQDDFLQLIKDFVVKSVDEIKTNNKFAGNILIEDETTMIGVCPECGNPVVETPKTFGCSNWKNGCKFAIWKNDKYINTLGKEVSEDMVKILLKNGKVGFKRLKGKNGNFFSAYFHYEKDDNGRYRWRIEYIN